MAESNQASRSRRSAAEVTVPALTTPAAPTSPAAASPDAGTPETPVRTRLLELARFEQEQAERVRTVRADFAQRAERLQVDVPALFFRMTRGLREAVVRYNQSLGEATQVVGALSYSDTPGVALGELHPGSEYLASVWRRNDRFDLRLRHLHSNRGHEVPLIEGIADLGRGTRERVLMRIEGWVKDGETTFWVSFDMQRFNVSVDDLPDRILMAVVRSEATYLVRDMAPPQPRRRGLSDDDEEGDEGRR